MIYVCVCRETSHFLVETVQTPLTVYRTASYCSPDQKPEGLQIMEHHAYQRHWRKKLFWVWGLVEGRKIQTPKKPPIRTAMGVPHAAEEGSRQGAMLFPQKHKFFDIEMGWLWCVLWRLIPHFGYKKSHLKCARNGKCAKKNFFSLFQLRE